MWLKMNLQDGKPTAFQLQLAVEEEYTILNLHADLKLTLRVMWEGATL